MNIRKLFFLTITGLLFVGCQNEVESPPAKRINIDVATAQMIDLAKEDWLQRQSFVLDSGDDCIIGLIDDVLAFDSLFLIRTQGRLLTFDYSGKFCGQISAQGRAGNEYISLMSIWHKENTLYLYDMNGKKVLLYSLDNKLISIINLPAESSSNPFTMLVPFHDQGFIGKKMYSGTPRVVSYELAYYNGDCSFQQVIGDTQLTSGICLGYSFSPYNHTVLYWRQLGNFIYSIDESLSLNEKYYVDFGEKNIPLSNSELKDEYDIIDFVNAAPIDRYATLLSNVIECDKYLVFCFLSNAKQHLVIYDKTSESSKIFYFADNQRILNIWPVSENMIMIFSFDETDNDVVYMATVQELVK